MPFYGFGPLRIVARQDLGALGPAQGPPVRAYCPAQDSLRRVLVWLVLLALLLRKPNRNRQAWSVVLALGAVSVLLHLSEGYINTHITFYLHRQICTVVCESLQALAGALAVLLALSDLFLVRRRFLRFVLVYLILFEVGAAAIFANAPIALSTGAWIGAYGFFLLLFLIGHAVLCGFVRVCGNAVRRLRRVQPVGFVPSEVRATCPAGPDTQPS